MSKPFEIPEMLLSQLNECSSGGYLLFTFDSNGMPKITSQFDSPSHATSMQFYVANWIKALDMLNIDATANAIMRQNKPRRKKK